MSHLRQLVQPGAHRDAQEEHRAEEHRRACDDQNERHAAGELANEAPRHRLAPQGQDGTHEHVHRPAAHERGKGRLDGFAHDASAFSRGLQQGTHAQHMPLDIGAQFLAQHGVAEHARDAFDRRALFGLDWTLEAKVVVDVAAIGVTEDVRERRLSSDDLRCPGECVLLGLGRFHARSLRRLSNEVKPLYS